MAEMIDDNAALALELAVKSAQAFEVQPSQIIERAKLYYGFLTKPEGIAQMTPELEAHLNALLNAATPANVNPA